MNRRKIRIASAIAIAVWAAVLWGMPGGLHAIEDAPYDPAILPPETITPPLPPIQPAPFANSGALVLKFPILVPPGRRAMTPELALTYRSGSGNGILGVGWQLSIGVIRRQAKDGLDYRGVRFEHDAEELVPRPDWGYGIYGVKRESAFRKYRFLADRQGWEVTDREGRSYHFGRSAESRMENEFGVLAWFLDKVVDANGNLYRIRYTRDADQVYPAEILYTGHDRLAPAHRVEFVYGSRPDPIESYESRTRVVTARRLEAIRTTAAGEPARLFQFLYETGRTGRSRLKEIRSEPLPPVRFFLPGGRRRDLPCRRQKRDRRVQCRRFCLFRLSRRGRLPRSLQVRCAGIRPLRPCLPRRRCRRLPGQGQHAPRRGCKHRRFPSGRRFRR